MGLFASCPLTPQFGVGGLLPTPLRSLPESLPLDTDHPIYWLTDDLLFHYQRCSRRAFLDLHGDPTQRDAPSDYLLKLQQDSAIHRQAILAEHAPIHRPRYPTQDWIAGAHTTQSLMQQGVERISRGILVTQISEAVYLVSKPDLLVKQEGWSIWGDWCYAPIDIKLGKKPKLDYQVVATFHAYVLANVQQSWPETSWLALREGRFHAVDLDRQLPKLEEVLTSCVQDLTADTQPDVFIAHSRCDLCHWFSHCYGEASATQHLSLLPGVTLARYTYLKSHHLTTVAALATANPAQLAPLPGFGETVAAKLVHQAQATLYNRAIARTETATQRFAWQSKTLPTAAIELYFDIEAAPDKDLVYLHGVLVVDRTAGTEQFHALVAETPDQEQEAWQAFLNLVGQFPQAPIFHFCPYELQTVGRLAQHYGNYGLNIEALLPRFVDIHHWITEAVTLPVESYALKHIARWVGFDWRDAGANGAQSICWYDDWLSTGDRTYLEAILRYNEDDCRATYHVKDWLVQFLTPYWQEANTPSTV